MITHEIQQNAAWTAVAVFGLMAIFQLLLAAGFPFGRLAWGGEHSRLPRKLRFASLISAGIFVIGGLCVLERASLHFTFSDPLFVSVIVWMLVGLFSLSTFGNIMSESTWEKRVMTPVAILLVIACLVVALGP